MSRHHWSFHVWPQLFPELAERIVGCIERNEIASTFRRLNKATAEQFSGPQHTTIHLSEPVPPHAFAAHWLAPGATRGLTLTRRADLMRLVAASGVLPNMEVALQAAGFTGAACKAFNAAAGAGQLSMCQWLWDYSRRREDLHEACCAGAALGPAAALPGHGEALARLAWLGGRGYPFDAKAVVAATRSGNTAAVQHLLEWVPVDEPRARNHIVYLAAGGRHLAVLQALHVAGWPIDRYMADATCEAAKKGHLQVLSWLLEVQWVEPLLDVVLDESLFAAAAGSGSVELLAWLRERGCRWSGYTFVRAAESGCAAAMEWLAEEGCPVEVSWGSRGSELALAAGSNEGLVIVYRWGGCA
ncbi:hypothetical protein GPECTOR_897g147 [Gonium pectorale]|uniref:Uncharacterized protein n=1 Tax=Gonium pectorale TaxID=33097 RepID=A0A150FTW9_GONPE|nr:hypothetical protein GPECTOR_897g147 [Gonium pectorale]|eukprot:KXZ41054.1 hypothetical protein GPECTOR_897g147 [Gonium pectorale]